MTHVPLLHCSYIRQPSVLTISVWPLCFLLVVFLQFNLGGHMFVGDLVIVGALFAGANIGGTADQTPPTCAILCRLQQLVC